MLLPRKYRVEATTAHHEVPARIGVVEVVAEVVVEDVAEVEVAHGAVMQRIELRSRTC